MPNVLYSMFRVLLYNEEYRQRRARRGKNTAYDQFLTDPQKAVALASYLLRQREDTRQEDLP